MSNDYDLTCALIGESDSEPCWGKVSIIDEDEGGNQIVACEGHAEAWDWACGAKSARAYIPKQ